VSGLTIVFSTVTVFLALYRRGVVLPSTLDPAFSLTLRDSASQPYTLVLMTWVGAIFLPLIVGYRPSPSRLRRGWRGRDSRPCGICSRRARCCGWAPTSWRASAPASSSRPPRRASRSSTRTSRASPRASRPRWWCRRSWR
jgi:hypothetical protein